jgi:hypothetical protein
MSPALFDVCPECLVYGSEKRVVVYTTQLFFVFFLGAILSGLVCARLLVCMWLTFVRGGGGGGGGGVLRA